MLLTPQPTNSFIKAHRRGRSVPEFRVLHDIADGRRARVMESVRRVLTFIASRATLKELAAAAEEGRAQRILELLGLSGEVSREFIAAFDEVKQELRAIFLAAGAATAETLPASITATLRFDGINPRSVDFLRNYEFRLIRGIHTVTVNGIRAAITASFIDGIRPFDTARKIKNIVGLTPRQVKQVETHRGLLISEGVKGAALSQRINKLSDRLLTQRANNIARTETIRAAVAGEQLLWMQAVDEGLIDSTARQIWIVTPDDRLCPICRPIPGRNAKGVPLGQFFDTPIGPISGPPAHPQCRCALALEGG